jgi:hypothetical protein
MEEFNLFDNAKVADGVGPQKSPAPDDAGLSNKSS